MAAECNSCGACCDPLVLPRSQREFAMTIPIDDEDAADRRFVLEDLTPLSRREARERAPYLFREGVTFGLGQVDGPTVHLWFYECKHFDKLERRCTNYEHRPPVCRGYPWYDIPRAQWPTLCLPDPCSYVEDIPVKFRRKRDPDER